MNAPPVYCPVRSRPSARSHDAVARTSGVAVPHPASARAEGSGTPAGGRVSGRPSCRRHAFGVTGRAAAARARGPGGTAQSARFFRKASRDREAPLARYCPVFTEVQSRVISRSVRASCCTVGNSLASTSSGGKIDGSPAISGSTIGIEAALALAYQT